MQVAYFGPAATPSSSKSKVLPSRETSRAFDQLSHERSRSRDSPAIRPTMPTRAVSSVISTRPERETSWIRKPSGRRASRRSRPFRLTAYREEVAPPTDAAVNQISSPEGDHASPSIPVHSRVSVRLCPARSTTATEPRLSTGIPGKLGRKNLDRDFPAQARVLRPVHLSHPARAERSEDLVGPETSAG